MAASPAAAQHLTRSASHYHAAELLEAESDEWAAVAYFYAAYRAVRAALQNDARLGGDKAARATDPKFTASTRHVEHHRYHPSRGPGINDIVKVLYPSIGAKYELLHIASIGVRYEGGLLGGTLADIKALVDDVMADLKSSGVI